jgi:hypothetical protein
MEVPGYCATEFHVGMSDSGNNKVPNIWRSFYWKYMWLPRGNIAVQEQLIESLDPLYTSDPLLPEFPIIDLSCFI